MHDRLIALIMEQRLQAVLTRAQVADRLGVPQSFVAICEGAGRRLDVFEFTETAQALEVDLQDLFATVLTVIAGGVD